VLTSPRYGYASPMELRCATTTRIPRCLVLAAAVKARWSCEQAHQQLKEELGLDTSKVALWHGLHHHTLLTMIASPSPSSSTCANAKIKRRRSGPPPRPFAAGDSPAARSVAGYARPLPKMSSASAGATQLTLAE
jgi:hypothetical protein